ncbi:MAG TPA: DUF1330 domain-containing protein [Longimicrobium sp.]|nr:DUF1330 domain-containing protein [Longimicrobium sp.]
MKYYVVAEMQITDPSWMGPYVQNVTRMIEAAGGRYLARTPRIEKLEGGRPAPQIQLLIEWPSREAALAFYHSDEYRPYLESRTAGGHTELRLVAGEDVTGAANVTE